MNERLARALGRLAGACARRPGTVIALWVLVAGAGLVLTPTLQGRLTNDAFLVDNSPSADLRSVLERDFPERAAPLHAAIPAGPGARAATARVATGLARRDDVIRATVVAPGSPERPGVVAIVARSGDESLTDRVPGLRAAAGRAAHPSDVHLGGVNAYFADVTTATRSDLAHAEKVGAPITLLVLIAAFGSLAAATLPLAVAAAGLGVAFALLLLLTGLLDLQIFVLNLAALVGLGVGVDYALLIVSRIRSELDAGHTPTDACAIAGRHAGHAVLVSGVAVLLSLAGIFAIGIDPYYGLALGTMITVATMVAAALTLLPATAAISARLLTRGRRRPSRATPRGRLAEFTIRRPTPVALAACVVLVVMALPLADVRFGLPGPELLPSDSGARVAAGLEAQALGPGGAAPILVAIDMRTVEPDEASAFAERARALPGARSVRTYLTDARLRGRSGNRGLIEVRTAGSAESSTAQRAVADLRDRAPTGVTVGGLPGERFDEIRRYEERLPFAVGVVLLATLIVLTLAFRSVLIPAKAVLVTLLSVGAALGACVWVFQEGHLVDLLGFQQIDGIPAFLPIFLFPIAFGLSTDYEVFLLSRIAEERAAGRDDREAIAAGLTATARTITGAAAVMVSVAAAFAATDLIPTQAVGFGISAAVLLDATIVRLLLVPALLALLGAAAWWWPRRSRGEAGPG